MSLPLSGQLGGAQLGAAEFGQIQTAGITPIPPPIVIMSATSGDAFGGMEEEQRRPAYHNPKPKAQPKKRKKRKKKVEEKQKPAEIVIQPDATAPEPLTEVAPVEPGVVAFPLEKPFNTAEYLQLIAEVQRAERLRETIAEEDELLLLGCLG